MIIYVSAGGGYDGATDVRPEAYAVHVDDLASHRVSSVDGPEGAIFGSIFDTFCERSGLNPRSGFFLACSGLIVLDSRTMLPLLAGIGVSPIVRTYLVFGDA